MEQEVKISNKKIMEKLSKIQSEIDYLKQHLNLEKNGEFKAEMNAWEEASEKDILDWEKENL